MFWYQILRPFSYLMIRHEKKYIFDWLAPCVGSLISTAVLLFGKDYVVVFGKTGLIASLLSFIQILPGFYIAALAAIATFNRNDIDLKMPEPSPKVDILIRGVKNTIDLTRRRFLCMLFSYLTAQAFTLSLASVVLMHFSDLAKSVIPLSFHLTTKLSVVALFSFGFWQMLIATFWGLYYLGDKLNQPDP